MQVTTMAEAEALTPAETEYFAKYQSNTPNLCKPDRRPQGKKPDTRGKSKHWKPRRFHATVKTVIKQYDPRTFKPETKVHLTDIYDYDTGELVTLNWIVPCPMSMQALCTHEGAVIDFEAEYSSTCYDAKRAGHPLLRPPFRKVASDAR